MRIRELIEYYRCNLTSYNSNNNQSHSIITHNHEQGVVNKAVTTQSIFLDVHCKTVLVMSYYVYNRYKV